MNEQQIRRHAAQRGMRVQKARSERYEGCGTYYVLDPVTRSLVSSEYGMTLDCLRDYLSEE